MSFLSHLFTGVNEEVCVSDVYTVCVCVHVCEYLGNRLKQIQHVFKGNICGNDVTDRDCFLVVC